MVHSKDIRVKISMPARVKCSDPAAVCERCAGVGLEVRRTYRRRSGAISTVVHQIGRDCLACGGSGEKPGLL